MKIQTQIRLYRILPVVFWLLAVCGVLVPAVIYLFFWTDLDRSVNYNYFYGFPVAAVVMACIGIIGHINPQGSSVEACFQMAILLGIASYGLPTVLLLIPFFWLNLNSRRIFDFRSFLATLIGLAFVAIWAAIFIALGYISNPWAEFFAIKNAWGWIPTGAALLAWLSSTIARRTLRVR